MMVVALGITIQGHKRILGLRQGATEKVPRILRYAMSRCQWSCAASGWTNPVSLSDYGSRTRKGRRNIPPK